MTEARVIAFYLPQFYPIPENDKWWGKGFTEWTNVGKAKPFFMGHYQPRVPADLGYYDLRLTEVREAQAQMAREHGIEGFCYWHYWFGNGIRLLDRPFNEVLASGKPDFPFCLGWANHSWKAKTWTASKEDKVLIEQKYPGIKDYSDHFFSVLPAFKDTRYIRINDMPLFIIWDPMDLPDASAFIKHWNDLAKSNGLDGIHFIAYCVAKANIEKYLELGFNSVTFDSIAEPFKNSNVFFRLYLWARRKFLAIPKSVNYKLYSRYVIKNTNVTENVFPCILPNFDHSPRSGKRALVLTNSTPENFGKLFESLLINIRSKNSENNIIFIKAWNEWGEGNYLEPDLKYGKGYLMKIKELLERYS